MGGVMSEEPKILGSVRRRAVRAAMALMLVACAVPVAGQELAPTRSEVKGRVLDASTRTPLAGAIVVLEGQPPGTIVDARGASAFRTMALTDETGVEGAYRFEGLASGVYVIRVVRLGYRPARVEIELRGAATSRVTLGLVIEPIALDPLEVTVAERPMMVRAPTTSEVDAQRIGNVELRQQQFLGFDVRVVGHTDLLEAVTLGETDIFRALQRLPGVSTRDDFTSKCGPAVRPGATPGCTSTACHSSIRCIWGACCRGSPPTRWEACFSTQAFDLFRSGRERLVS